MIKLPSGVDINNLIDDLRIFSWEASEIMLYYSKIIKNSDFKRNFLKTNDHSNPVTVADLKVNELIIRRLNEKYKNIEWSILSEENVKDEKDTSQNFYDWTWILDPLDGTKDFIQGTGNYAMHLALCHKQIAYLGLVLIPEKDELWLTNGQKIWCESKDRLQSKATLSKSKIFKEMTIVTSKNHQNQNLSDLIKNLNFQDIVVMGSIGCKIASILRGESDIYISLSLPGKSCPKDWDFAAPEAILKASGGAITNLDNQQLLYGSQNYDKGGIIVASNNHKIHENICLEIKDIVKKYNLYPLNS